MLTATPASTAGPAASAGETLALAQWLPHLRAVLVESIERTEAGVEVSARPAAPQAACPACGT